MSWRHRHHHHQVPKRLRRKILFGFGAAILASGLSAAIIGRILYDGEWGESRKRMESFATGELARLWDDPVQRDGLVTRLSEAAQARMELTDAAGTLILARGPACDNYPWTLPITRDGQALGTATLCMPKHKHSRAAFMLPFLVACCALWAAAGSIAHRLTRPLGALVQVTQEIGSGRYDARANIDCRTPDEVSVLGEAINDMAARIERQLKEQKMMLAAVSHELRTPLGHLRILTEIARERGAEPKTLDDIESEIKELDDLVGELLARSRLDFTELSERPLEASELAARAIERAGLGADRLQVVSGPHAIMGDPTLILRALANLIDNATKHGGGLERLVVGKGEDGAVAFAAEDRGPGLPKGEESRVFEPFYRREESGTLGLGLALVDRIARAHKGRAVAENRPDGGARVALLLPAV